MMKSRYWWPEVFETGVLDVDARDPNGKGMAAIGAFLNVTPTPENLSEYGKQFLGEDEQRAVPAPQSQPEGAQTAATPLCDCPDECRHIPCSKCGKATTFDPTYGDLCYRCIRADNE